MGYKDRAIRGVFWLTLFRGSSRIATFVRLAILGRLLTPAEFGFFGIAALLLALLEIITETGINVFLVQEKKHISEYINSAWLISILRGTVLGILIFFMAPFISVFFNAPQSTPIIALISLVPFIRGFINPAIIIYQKELLFHREFQLRSFLFLVDVTVSIVVAFITRSAASFVWGLLVSAVFEVTFSYILIPLWPKLLFEFEKVKYVFKRGGWVTLTGIFNYFAENGDNLAVGKILGSSSLGIYQVAYKFSTLSISEITNVINQVLFPVYSKFSDDLDRIKRSFLRVMVVSSFGALVLGGVIFIMARPLILIFMGDQWVGAVPAIKILAIYGIVRTVFGNFSPMFLSIGKQDYVAKMTFVRCLALAAFIIPLVNNFGMVGAGYAMLISIFFEIPVIILFTLKVFRKS